MRVGQLGMLSTPAAMQARLEQLRAAASTLARDISGYAPPSGREEEWSRWAAAWGDWLGAFHRFSPDWVDRTMGATANQIEGYAKQLDEARTAFRMWPGAIANGPEVATEESPLDTLGKALRGSAYALGGLVAAGLVALAITRRR